MDIQSSGLKFVGYSVSYFLQQPEILPSVIVLEACTGLLHLQIRVGMDDDSWIYGTYTCRASNFVGSSSTDIQLREASQFMFITLRNILYLVIRRFYLSCLDVRLSVTNFLC